MHNTLKNFIKECLSDPLMSLTEATARIFNLSQASIVRLLDDILSGEPVMNYTEKLAGTFFEIQITNGHAGGRYKDAKKRGEGFWDDAAGVASVITRSGVFEGQTVLLQFEILDPHRIADYINYALGSKPLAVEVTGKLTSAQARRLNKVQKDIRFMSQQDIVKKPKPLSLDLRNKIQQARDKAAENSRLTADEKKQIENLVSSSLSEIFGDSVLGGQAEGLFITGGEKPFKVPNKVFADIQRIQAPMYALFSGRGGISSYEIANRLSSVSGDTDKIQSDKMIKDIRSYLETAASGSLPKGFRTFFTPQEAISLLSLLNDVLQKQKSPSKFVELMSKRIGHRSTWVST